MRAVLVGSLYTHLMAAHIASELIMTKAGAPTSSNTKRDPYRLDKSNAHFRKAVKKLPLGVSSNFRYWGDNNTVYVKHGRGARVIDLDDNVYIDYRLGYGPAILGHCHPDVDAAAREAQSIGTVFALGTEKEVTVAKLIKRMMPAAQLVLLSNSGTEDVMATLRLAPG